MQLTHTPSPFPQSDSAHLPRPKVSRSVEITRERLASFFHVPSELACRELGIGLTVLKRQCRKYGIPRWPFRKMKSLDNLIQRIAEDNNALSASGRTLPSVEELEEQKRKLEECAILDLDVETKRMQQAFSKATHKQRQNLRRYFSGSCPTRPPQPCPISACDADLLTGLAEAAEVGLCTELDVIPVRPALTVLVPIAVRRRVDELSADISTVIAESLGTDALAKVFPQLQGVYAKYFAAV